MFKNVFTFKIARNGEKKEEMKEKWELTLLINMTEILREQERERERKKVCVWDRQREKC